MLNTAIILGLCILGQPETELNYGQMVETHLQALIELEAAPEVLEALRAENPFLWNL